MLEKACVIALIFLLLIGISAGCGGFAVPWAMQGMDLSEYDSVCLVITEISEKYFTAVSIEDPDKRYNVRGELYEEFREGNSLTVYYNDDPVIVDSVTHIRAKYIGVANEANQILAKPVIYLYPAKATEVTVTLELEGPLTCSVPEYVNGWTVTAFPDGTLIGSDGQTYPYLFWEADSDIRFDLSEGFCIEGEETPGFLREKLTFLGLNEQETSGFIDYWVPLMKDNAYNLISFQTYAYTDNVKLTVRPEPDSVLRVFMAYSPLGKPVKIKAQELQPFQRTGFTVVEWGGAKSAYAVYH